MPWDKVALAFPTSNHRALSKGVAIKQLCLFQTGKGPPGRSAPAPQGGQPPLCRGQACPGALRGRIRYLRNSQEGLTREFPRQTDSHLRQVASLSTDVCLGVAELRVNHRTTQRGQAVCLCFESRTRDAWAGRGWGRKGKEGGSRASDRKCLVRSPSGSQGACSPPLGPAGVAEALGAAGRARGAVDSSSGYSPKPVAVSPVPYWPGGFPRAGILP